MNVSTIMIYFPAIVISLFLIISIILFIWDSIRAKRKGTGRKEGIVIIFIISMATIVLGIVIGIMFYILSTSFMWSM